MASKSSSPGPNPTTNPVPKQARSRKAATQNINTGRAGSSGGIILEKEVVAKPKSTPISKSTAPKDASNDALNSTPRRKPRKLNKDPTPIAAPATAPPKLKATPAEAPTSTEIEALKSRVRGLEAKVEEIYKTGSLDRPGRSPRRRGKGCKASSTPQVPTLSTTKSTALVEDDDDDVEEIGRGDPVPSDGEEEGVEELVRLEGELEVARQDLAAIRPRKGRSAAAQDNDNDDDDVEDIPRENNRHVTLSGSYRIPLPASVSVDDVKHIQSGVSAAQNVARSFLEQRRAANTLSPSPSSSSTSTKRPARPPPKSVSSSLEIVPQDAEGKKSWGEWIGGYSVAISRAVGKIEHEAAVESRKGSGSGGGRTKKSGASGGGGGKKRPGVKTKMSGEQVDGLMS
jgi:hypothetical protein